MYSIRCITSVPGLENAKIVRNAYAIEYDCIDATAKKLHWNLKRLTGSAVVSLMEVQDMKRQQHKV